jgi:hypothetical protein
MNRARRRLGRKLERLTCVRREERAIVSGRIRAAQHRGTVRAHTAAVTSSPSVELPGEDTIEVDWGSPG